MSKLGRPRSNSDEKLSEQLYFRATREERASIESLAQKAHLPYSTFVRKLVLAELRRRTAKLNKGGINGGQR